MEDQKRSGILRHQVFYKYVVVVCVFVSLSYLYKKTQVLCAKISQMALYVTFFETETWNRNKSGHKDIRERT